MNDKVNLTITSLVKQNLRFYLNTDTSTFVQKV